MDSMGLFSGNAGSADENMRSQNCPRKRTVEMRGRPLPIQTAFAALWPATAIFTSYFPSFDPVNRQTVLLSAGMWTGGAVMVIWGGRSSASEFSASAVRLDTY